LFFNSVNGVVWYCNISYSPCVIDVLLFVLLLLLLPSYLNSINSWWLILCIQYDIYCIIYCVICWFVGINEGVPLCCYDIVWLMILCLLLWHTFNDLLYIIMLLLCHYLLLLLWLLLVLLFPLFLVIVDVTVWYYYWYWCVGKCCGLLLVRTHLLLFWCVQLNVRYCYTYCVIVVCLLLFVWFCIPFDRLIVIRYWRY
jgi:hypothetical protein